MKASFLRQHPYAVLDGIVSADKTNLMIKARAFQLVPKFLDPRPIGKIHIMKPDDTAFCQIVFIIIKV